MLPENECFKVLYNLGLTYDDVSDDVATPELLKEVTRLVIENIPNIKRGDVVQLGTAIVYRNDCKFLWDGEKAIDLRFDEDEYGGLPFEFAYPEFDLEHFDDNIEHNKIRWVAEEHFQELCDAYDVHSEDEEEDFNYESQWRVFIVPENGARVDDDRVYIAN